MERIILVLATMGLAVVLACGAAFAVTSSGTEGDDTLEGTTESDIIGGRGGSDSISGFEGGDLLYGEAGDDLLLGGEGADTLRGDQGDDAIVDGVVAEQAMDTIRGADGNDDIMAANIPARKDDIACGPGTDKVQADTLDAVAADCESVLRSAENEVVLQPSASSDQVLDQVTYSVQPGPTDDDGVSVLEAQDDGTTDDASTAYDLTADLQTRTYEAEALTQEELDQQVRATNEELGGAVTSDRARRYWVAAVRLQSRDRVGVPLARSSQRLWWSSGSSVRYNDRRRFASAECPTMGEFSCWHKSYSRFAGLGYIDGGRTLRSKNEAGFWNRDFGDFKLYTVVQHELVMYAYNSNRFNYIWTAYHLGEARRLLVTRATIVT